MNSKKKYGILLALVLLLFTISYQFLIAPRIAQPDGSPYTLSCSETNSSANSKDSEIGNGSAEPVKYPGGSSETHVIKIVYTPAQRADRISTVALYVREIEYDATSKHDLVFSTTDDAFIGDITVTNGILIFSVGGSLSLAPNSITVNDSGYRIHRTRKFVSFNKPLVLTDAQSRIIQINTVNEKGDQVSGSLTLKGGRVLQTGGQCLIYDVANSETQIYFSPDNDKYFRGHATIPPHSEAPDGTVTIDIVCLCRLNLQFEFILADNTTSTDRMFTVIVEREHHNDRQAEWSAKIHRIIRGELVGDEVCPVPGRYRFTWIYEGRRGVPYEVQRSSLASSPKITLHEQPNTHPDIILHIINSEGNAVAGVKVFLTYQGENYVIREHVSDSKGLINIPFWDKKLVTLVVRFDEYLDVTPNIVDNPETGEVFVVDIHNGPSKIVLRSNTHKKMLHVATLRLWAPPSIPSKAVQLVSQFNHRGIVHKFTLEEPFQLEDPIRTSTLSDIQGLLIVLSVNNIQVRTWTYSSYSAISEKEPAIVDVSHVHNDPLVVMNTGKYGDGWLISTGRRTAAEMVGIMYGSDDLRLKTWAEAPTAKNTIETLRTYEYTGINKDGTYCLFTTKKSGNELQLVLSEFWRGSKITLQWTNTSSGQFLLSPVYYEDGKEILYVTEYTCLAKSDKENWELHLPEGMNVLVLPVGEGFEPLVALSPISSNSITTKDGLTVSLP